MALKYGKPANPEAFIIAQLKALGQPVDVERDEQTPQACYVVTSVANHSDRYLLDATVTVHSYGATRAAASDAAWAADELLLSLTPGDVVTLPNGIVAGAWVCPHMPPTWDQYRAEPTTKRYVARYDPQLRFVP